MATTERSLLRRFSLVQRLFHLLLMLSFTFQAATGLGRMFHETLWGQGVAAIFGGYQACARLHRYVGVFMIALFLGHLLYVLVLLGRRRWSGGDLLLPRLRDLAHFLRHTAWILGLGRPPEFERWGYWEKFDYWAVFWGMVIIGLSGLMLAFPLAATRWLPGWSLNLAFWVHRIEALLAMAHVFVIHFFIAHLRRQNFPMDLAVFEGGVSLEHARRHRPGWVLRLESQGVLQEQLVPPASLPWRLVYYGLGFAVMAVCVYLLVGALANAGRVTW